ncbi:MAG: hypothetical protein WC002_09920, partial [Candidatus Muiribacteriota bacterium]
MEYNFLDLTLTPHDKNNIELKISYLFHRHTPKNDYEVETYFFIPKNLAVNERQLSNNDFYKRLHNYVRLKTPQINLDCVSNLKPSSPLINLETAINNLILNPGDYRLAKKYEYEIKMAGSIIKSSLRDYTEFIRDKKPAENDRIRLLNQYLKYSESILANISRLWETICI